MQLNCIKTGHVISNSGIRWHFIIYHVLLRRDICSYETAYKCTSYTGADPAILKREWVPTICPYSNALIGRKREVPAPGTPFWIRHCYNILMSHIDFPVRFSLYTRKISFFSELVNPFLTIKSNKEMKIE